MKILYLNKMNRQDDADESSPTDDVLIEPCGHFTKPRHPERRIAAPRQFVIRIWEAHESRRFPLLFEGDVQLFRLFDRTAVVFLPVQN